MKTRLFQFYLTLFFLVFNLITHGQAGGKILENNEIKSAILGKLVAYSVYLPNDYETSERNYPVIYYME